MTLYLMIVLSEVKEEPSRFQWWWINEDLKLWLEGRFYPEFYRYMYYRR